MKASVRLFFTSLACTAALSMLTAPSARADDRDALRHIVQEQCLAHWSQAHDPSPCVRLVQSGAQGYAVLADRKGGAHFLLIPTPTLTGMEDARLLSPDTPNYFAAAWQARDQLATVVGHAVRREAVGLAINSALARGQDQLHIHIECLRPPLYHALQAAASGFTDHWAPWRFEESRYMALRIRAEELSAANPIELLANSLPGARQSMGDYTMLVAGAQFADGPGFIVLTGRTPTRAAALAASVAGGFAPGLVAPGLVAPGETLLDATCAIDP